MLATCKKCRTTRDIKLKVDNPKNIKINKANLKGNTDVKFQPICTNCGTENVVNDFVLQLMVEKRDFIEEKSRTSKAKCHACQSEQEIKLDTMDNPRCMRCGGVVKLTKFMVNAMKNELKLFMTAKEMKKLGIVAEE